ELMGLLALAALAGDVLGLALEHGRPRLAARYSQVWAAAASRATAIRLPFSGSLARATVSLHSTTCSAVAGAPIRQVMPSTVHWLESLNMVAPTPPTEQAG